VALEIGMVLAAFLFMRNMIKFSDVSLLTTGLEEKSDSTDILSIDEFNIPEHAQVFEISGPLFFGAAYKFKDAMRFIEKSPKVLIIRMRHVPIIDATGIKTIEEVFKESKKRGTKIILSEINSEQVKKELRDSRLMFAIGKANITE